ncbi:uncharacterized protein EV420DRAFT_1483840 [Desarmillaria tabescens]|uniref:Zn(2)-C6 fungal-type domain-containing protein n=1 Tax=Armillaria tabescens TaxID=1929756 RepID=A0AA39JVU1_ARMTA|nr:uncharacterized protein EV420DRAFT_1483840 [Desarmillaria tabescens]KAK0447493.1 hypothetical protein EV420DRAFT_1483840 [Desarmillaria tabescens]
MPPLDRFSMLHSAVDKSPAIWDSAQADRIGCDELVSQINEAHVFLTAYCASYPPPYPNIVDSLLVTASATVQDLPPRLQNPLWCAWQLSPEVTETVLLAGPFTLTEVPLLVELPPPPPRTSPRKHKGGPSPPVADRMKFGLPCDLSKDVPKRSKRDTPVVQLKATPIKTEPVSEAPSSVEPPSTKSTKTHAVSVKSDKTEAKTCGRHGREVVETPLPPSARQPMPTIAVIAEDTHGISGCTMCASRRVLCTHKEPHSTCANCAKLGHCSCRLSADDLQEVRDTLLPLAQGAYPLVEMYDINFRTADRTICHLLNCLHDTYQIWSASLCNMLQAFAQIEEDHDTDTLMKFACCFPVGRRLLIDMGLVEEKDNKELDHVAAPQVRHYYPREPARRVETLTGPEPSLPSWRAISPYPSGAEQAKVQESKDGEDETQVADDLQVDQLHSSPVHPERRTRSSSLASDPDFYASDCTDEAFSDSSVGSDLVTLHPNADVPAPHLPSTGHMAPKDIVWHRKYLAKVGVADSWIWDDDEALSNMEPRDDLVEGSVDEEKSLKGSPE